MKLYRTGGSASPSCADAGSAECCVELAGGRDHGRFATSTARNSRRLPGSRGTCSVHPGVRPGAAGCRSPNRAIGRRLPFVHAHQLTCTLFVSVPDLPVLSCLSQPGRCARSCGRGRLRWPSRRSARWVCGLAMRSLRGGRRRPPAVSSGGRARARAAEWSPVTSWRARSRPTAAIQAGSGRPSRAS
jgi:hypothetical protein